jgi:hypothetical protein
MKKRNKSIRFRSTSSEASEKASGGTPQGTKAISALSKGHSWLYYMSDNSFKFYPSQSEWRERLIYTMYEWVQGDVLEIMEFCVEYKLAYVTLREYVDKYEDVRKAYADIKLMLASRRRIGVIKRKYDKEMICKDLFRYDPEWLMVDKYHSDMKKNESGEQQKIGVVLPCYNSCCVKGEK